MTKLTPLSRAAAPVVVLGLCLLACALQGAFACPASAFTESKAAPGNEGKALDLTQTTGQPSHSATSGPSLVRTIVGLAIVIAVIWGLSWVLRQVKAGRDPAVSSSGLASVSALTLGSGRSVHLVRAGNEYVLLGSAEHGVVPIHRYTEEQARAAGMLPDESSSRPRRLRIERRSPAGPSDSRPVAAGQGRSDPMRMPSPSSGLIERMREWTVRR
jgi:flagellar protein FliO/FliZ